MGDVATRILSVPQVTLDSLDELMADRITFAKIDVERRELNALRGMRNLTQTEPLTASFIRHPELEFAGASPDRLIAEDGLLEAKCPTTPTHIDTLLSGEIAERYVLQMQWQMACTGRNWCDFVSFDPRVPPDYQCFVTRVERDDEVIAWLETEAASFLLEVEHSLDALAAARPALPHGLCA